jgi:hypothetical protein
MEIETVPGRTAHACLTSPTARRPRIAMWIGALGIVGAMALTGTLAGCSAGGWERPPPNRRDSPAPGTEGTSPGDHSGQPFGEKG